MMICSDVIREAILQRLQKEHYPKQMSAWTVRSETLGKPLQAFRQEKVPVPPLRPGEILVANITAGLNYNAIWAAQGRPKDVICSNGSYLDEKQSFQICGSESAGIVYAVADDVVRFRPGDAVCVGGARYDRNCPVVQSGEDPCFSPTYHIWGYEGNYGAYAEFSRVQETQCVEKPAYLSWEEAAGITATGVTVYRMLHHWQGNQLRPGDVVLIWGGTGGIGMSAIELVKAEGGIPVAVVSSEEKGKQCIEQGATGFINRKAYHHWGAIGDLDEKAYQKRLIEMTRFRNEFYRIVGKKRLADIVIEHPGRDTLPTSLFLCKPGGMVVLCGATTSYLADIDLRFLWLEQKRIQGCHAGTLADYEAYMKIMQQHQLHPYQIRTFGWDELPAALQAMQDNTMTGKSIIRIEAHVNE